MFHQIASRVKHMKGGIRLELMVIDDVINSSYTLRATRSKLQRQWIDLTPKVRQLRKKMEMEPYPMDEHYKKL
ncbi:hypothetical protein SK128_003767 [Halocaridina rubra]|uniref:Uncharacterized protein n=1 Tax=Halocaridina rubra TaxID=373956 RepID=A0AAN9A1V4_HALRR